MVVRKDVIQGGAWSETGSDHYPNSTIDNTFNDTYINALSSTVRSLIGTTTFYYTVGGYNPDDVKTLTRAIFALSTTELGISNPNANKEGETLPIASTLNVIVNSSGGHDGQWTRTRSRRVDENLAFYVTFSGSVGMATLMEAATTVIAPYRPCFTLPADAFIDTDLNLVEN